MASVNHSIIGADSQYTKPAASSMPPIIARANQLGKAEDSSPEKPRSAPVPQHPIQFDLLPPETQEAKLKNIRKIEANWGAPLRRCIPAKIRPRKPDGYITKAKRHEISAALEDDPKQWGVDLLARLAEISDLTMIDLGTALKELQDKVADRHNYGSESNHNIAELLSADCDNALIQLRDVQKKRIAAAEVAQEQPPPHSGTAGLNSTRPLARPMAAGERQDKQDKRDTPTSKTTGAQASRPQASRVVSTPPPPKAEVMSESPRARRAVQTHSASPAQAPTAPMTPTPALVKRAQAVEAVSTPPPLKANKPAPSQQSTENQIPAMHTAAGATEAAQSPFQSNAPAATMSPAATSQAPFVTASPSNAPSTPTGVSNLFTSPNHSQFTPTSASPFLRKRPRMELEWEMLDVGSRVAEANREMAAADRAEAKAKREKAEVDHKKLKFMMDLDREEGKM
ncbi:hypothetical protein H2201_003951 [Coniosporium apollinis]|uniref:Uncharacterized protein n=1 Tax=Coniosporium apollinis TaxID=61459 RepID=A0ABQ9NZJ7_9PEZI|nr:hypothetical protein H2201_003951 [Coniosporium apollinis]